MTQLRGLLSSLVKSKYICCVECSMKVAIPIYIQSWPISSSTSLLSAWWLILHQLQQKSDIVLIFQLNDQGQGGLQGWELMNQNRIALCVLFTSFTVTRKSMIIAFIHNLKLDSFVPKIISEISFPHLYIKSTESTAKKFNFQSSAVLILSPTSFFMVGTLGKVHFLAMASFGSEWRSFVPED